MNDLGIDPKNFRYDFGRDWTMFQETRVAKFLVLYLRREIEQARTALERATTFEDVRLQQGAINEARHLLTILKSPNVISQVNDVLTSIN
jgi:hypothetical protein